jgi:hypothetical protein
MPEIPDNLEQWLLDYHLGQLEPEQARRVSRLIAEDAAVAAQSRRVERLVARLDGYTVSEPPADLADKVLARVESFKATTVRLEEAGSPAAAGEAGGESGWRLWSVRELVATAAALAVIVGVFFPAAYRVRSVARRDQCQANLAQLGQSMAGYAADHDDALPYAGHVPGAVWLRTAEPNQPVAANTRHLYRLVKEGRVSRMRLFICPASRNDRPMEVDDPTALDDFADASNVSYSFQNQGKRPLRINVRVRLPVLADRNPFIRGGQFRVPGRTDINSDAHGHGKGQNVQYWDGSVLWRDSAAAGPGGDNIWLAGQQRQYRGTEEPLGETDAFLIP